MRGWEGGILRFLSARFAEKHGFWGSIREAVQASQFGLGWLGARCRVMATLCSPQRGMQALH